MLKRIFIVSIFYYLFNTNCFSAFVNVGNFSRATAFGDAFSSIADDISSVYYNPGGLGGIYSNELTLQYSVLYYGLMDNSSPIYNLLGLLKKLKFGTLGITYSNLISTQYSENIFSVGYGLDIFKFLSAGFTLKYMYLNIDSDMYTVLDEAIRGYPRNFVNFDFGFLVSTPNKFRYSFVVKNLLSNNLAVKKEEDIPSEVRFGVARIGESFKIDFDLVLIASDISVGGGLEKIFSKTFSLRGGLQTGSRGLANISAGWTLKYKAISVNYALKYPLSGLKGTLGSHYIDLTFSFDTEKDFFKTDAEKKVESLKIELDDIKNNLTEKTQIIQQKEEEIKKMQEEKEKILLNMKNLPEEKQEIQEKEEMLTEEEIEDELKKKKKVTIHVVIEKDTLQSLAEKYYNDESKWKIIYNYNKNKIRMGQLIPGTEIIIP